MNEYENLNERTKLIKRTRERLIGRRKMLEVVLFTPQWKHSSTIWRVVGNILHSFQCEELIAFIKLTYCYIYTLGKDSRCVCCIEIHQVSIADICQTATTSGGVLFSNQLPIFCTKNAKLWPILTYFGDFVANSRTFVCTFVAVVSQN